MAFRSLCVSSFTGGYSYSFVDGEPPNKYICHICTLPARDPQQVSCCYNIYCNGCLLEFKEKGQDFNCPTCRQPLAGNYFKDGRADREIRALQVHCTTTGCTWVGTVADIEAHVANNCLFKLVMCTNGCGTELMASKLKEHLKEHCIQRIVTCQYCRGTGKHSVMTSIKHLNKCPQYPIKCINKDCSAMIPRNSLLSHVKVCPKALIGCEYSSIGCGSMVRRDEMGKHHDEAMKQHLQMAVKTVVSLKTQVKTLEEKFKTVDGLKSGFQAANAKTAAVQQSVQAVQKQAASISAVQAQNVKAVESLTDEISALQVKDKTYVQVYKLTDFAAKKDKKFVWYNPAFYISPGSYKMMLCVDTSEEDKNEYIRCYLSLVKGDYDDALEWPFKGVATVELLNQLEDNNHKGYDLIFDETLPDLCKERVIGKASGLGWGFSEFIAHSELGLNSSKTCQYLMDDTLYFRVSVKATSKTKPWLVGTNFN